MKTNHALATYQVARMRRTILRTVVFISAGAPLLVPAQYTEIKMGEYLHYAVAAANGGVYAGIDGIGYTGVGFGTPSVYQTNTGWVDLSGSLGFTNASPYGQPKGISHDGSVVAGYMVGVVSNGISIQCAAYWVNGVESLVPAPPDDPTPTGMSATGVSGDGTTLIVQDQTANKTESYVFNIAGGTFTSVGFLPGTNQQTYATTINNNGTVVAGYYNLDNGDIHGFLWDATNGLRDMGIPTITHPNTHYLEPTCISDDGTTVFGQLTEFNGWIGFRYKSSTGFQDLNLTPSSCTADGTEAVGIQNMYFPAAWSLSNGGGYLDHLLTVNGTTQALGTVEGPVTISPDGSAITALGPDAYLTDQVWYGTWQVFVPVPLKTAPIVAGVLRLSTAYAAPLIEPPGTLIQNAEFNNGASALLDRRPSHAASFVFGADGSFSYTPQASFSNRTDHFYYQLVSTNGTSLTNEVQIYVAAPAPPAVDTPTAANVTATTAMLGGNVSGDGGAPITAIGVVYAPTAIDSAPQIGDVGASLAFGTGTTGVFTVDISGLMPGTDYSYTAFATNTVGVGYSQVGTFTTLWTPESFQVAWYGSTTNSAGAWNADPYQTGVPNFAVFAFLGPYQDPSTASPALLPQVQLSGGNLFYDFFEPYAISGISYGALWSATFAPNDWHAVPDTGDPTTTPPSHLFSVPTAANTQLFMRLTVTFQ